jgi:hypothetical protein
MNYRFLALALLSGILAGCATPTATSPGGGQTAQTNVPSADWENLGVSPNGNILNEIDRLSIQRQGDMVSFRDRKTIFDLHKENFLGTPRHKVSINNWVIDCQAHTFQLKTMTLFDENGRQIASFTYNDNQIKPMPVVQNSASYQQMLYVCH